MPEGSASGEGPLLVHGLFFAIISNGEKEELSWASFVVFVVQLLS